MDVNLGRIKQKKETCRKVHTNRQLAREEHDVTFVEEREQVFLALESSLKSQQHKKEVEAEEEEEKEVQRVVKPIHVYTG